MSTYCSKHVQAFNKLIIKQDFVLQVGYLIGLEVGKVRNSRYTAFLYVTSCNLVCNISEKCSVSLFKVEDGRRAFITIFRYRMIKTHGLISKETPNFIATAARTSHLNTSQNAKHNATFLEASVSSFMWWFYVALRSRCTDETFSVLYPELGYGHVQRMEVGRLPKQAMKWNPPGRRKRGRPKLT